MTSDREFLWLYDNLNVCNTKQHQNYYTLTLRCSQHCNTRFVSFPVRACTIISGPFLCCTALLCFCQSCSFSSTESGYSWRGVAPFSPLCFSSLLSPRCFRVCMICGEAAPRGGGRTGELPHIHGIKERGKCFQTPLVFRNLSQVEAFRDTAQSHKEDNCERKVGWVRKQQQYPKKSSYFQTPLTLF